MSDPTTPDPTPTPADPPQEPAAATPEPSTPPAEPPKSTENPWDNPEVARTEIERLRRENAASRTNAKAQAAEDARNELAQSIGKALGLVKDEPVDPARLTEQLTQAQEQARQSALELAVYRAAPSADAATALLDSRSFLAKVADIDPSEGDKIAEAVTGAVQENPALGKRAPAPNPAQGSSAGGPPRPVQLTQADLAGMSPEQITEARQKGQLDDLLGIKR